MSVLRQMEKQWERKLDQLITVRRAQEIMNAEFEKVKMQYELNYTRAALIALNSAPFKFGKKRLGDFIQAYIGQMDALGHKVITTDDMKQTLDDMGVTLEHKGKEFHISFDGGK